MIKPAHIRTGLLVVATLLFAYQVLKPTGIDAARQSPVVTSTTNDGKLEIRVTSADQRISYRNIENKIVCSEPSPDATLDVSSAGASGISATIAKGVGLGAKAQNDASHLSSSNAIFARSQSIQYFRDGMYYLCLSHMNGTLSEEDYKKSSALLMERTFKLLQVELNVPKEVVAASPEST